MYSLPIGRVIPESPYLTVRIPHIPLASWLSKLQ